jgi:hypothetical protein
MEQWSQVDFSGHESTGHLHQGRRQFGERPAEVEVTTCGRVPHIVRSTGRLLEAYPGERGVRNADARDGDPWASFANPEAKEVGTMRNGCLVFAALSLCLACSSSGGRPNNGGRGGEDEPEGGSGGSDVGGKGGNSGGTGGKASGGAGGITGGTGGGGSGGTAEGGSGGSAGAGSGGSGGSAEGGSGGSGGATGGAGGESGSPAAALNMLLLETPCPGSPSNAGDCSIANAADRKKMKTVTLGGNPATTYKVKLHFCGPVEGRSYTGCKASMEDKLVCVDGTPATTSFNPTYPAYSMVVAEPMHTYYLNNGFKADDLIKVDYSATFEMKGGTMVTLASDGGSNANVYSSRWKGHNFMCPGVPMIMQPYWGQFLYVTVESIDPM